MKKQQPARADVFAHEPRATFTRDEAAGLWHAVRALGDMVHAAAQIEGITPEQIAAEKRRHAFARAALCKVQAMRRAAR